MPGKLYLIPVPLGDVPVSMVLPPHITDVINALDTFAVEDLRSARRFLIKAGIRQAIDDLQFHLLNKHSTDAEIQSVVSLLAEGKDLGIISEAGVPAVADPGSDLVDRAHRIGATVEPLVGPSSILMALMASGMNGQTFHFDGYLPVKRNERVSRIRQLEKQARKDGATQIFMETPYRNHALLKDLLEVCHNQTRLCIAADISLPGAMIRTRTVEQWQKKMPDIHKRPAIFLIECI